jgi:two-component system, chemotaxis family, response regulator Rcp1
MAASGWNPNQGRDPLSSSLSRPDASAQKRRQILVVEDNKPDVFLIREALATAGVNADVYVVHDGLQATAFFDKSDSDIEAQCPDLVLLDLNLPKESGEDVLRHMRNSRTCKDALVLIVTSSDSPKEREATHALGACGYFRKPSEYAEFMKLGPIVNELLTSSS